MTVAKTYVCKNKHKPETITEPLNYTTTCGMCGEEMIEGHDE